MKQQPVTCSCCILALLLVVNYCWTVCVSSSQVLVDDDSSSNFVDRGYDAALQKMEKDFINWVNWIGALRHSIFSPAKNKFIVSRTIIVSKLIGQGDFTTVQQAVNSIPDHNTNRVVIQIRPGYYREKVSVPSTKPYITFQGSCAWCTIIDWGDTASSLGPDGQPMGTFASATVAVSSAFFIAKNVTFKNSALVFPLSAADNGKQAVALRISGDNAAFYDCHFVGSQDTLYDHIGRHYFKDCYVEGSVDFIFGDGHSYYYNCHLHAPAAKSGGTGALTAQKRTNQSEETGFSFVNCNITGSGTIYLGRAWGDFSRVVYAYTYMDNVVVPRGWHNWGDPKREQTVFYGQYKCYGPGASHEGRVVWSHELTDQQAGPFLDPSFVDGSEWLPA